MTTCAAECLAAASYNNLVSPETGPFELVEVSPKTIITDAAVFQIPVQSAELDWNHRQNSQSDNSYAHQTNHSTNQTTEAT